MRLRAFQQLRERRARTEVTFRIWYTMTVHVGQMTLEPVCDHVHRVAFFADIRFLVSRMVQEHVCRQIHLRFFATSGTQVRACGTIFDELNK